MRIESALRFQLTVYHTEREKDKPSPRRNEAKKGDLGRTSSIC